MAVNHICTSTGFECDIDSEVLNDFEMLDLVTEADNGDIMALNKMIEGKKALEELNRTHISLN